MNTPPEGGPVPPGAAEWLGKKIPCLDHGFIYLVDVMGSDASIVQAARVSYGLGTKSMSEDRTLIRYLMRHQHTTPFEMVEFKFHVKLPIFVARQWIRHRTACITGDARLIFDLPGAERSRRRRAHGIPIEKLHRLWHEGTSHPVFKKKPLFLDRVEPDGEYTVPELARRVARRAEDLRNLIQGSALRATRVRPESPTAPSLIVRGHEWHAYVLRTYTVRVPMRGRVADMHLRMCDEVTGEIAHTRIRDVWESGVKPVFRVTLENGYALKMTRDHRCLTDRGWMTLGEATKLALRPDGGVTWDGNAPRFAVNGAAACADVAWLSARRQEGLTVAEIADRAGTSYHTIRKYLCRFQLSFTSAERSRLSGLAQRGQRRASSGPRELTEGHLAAIRRARSGESSNFWKGGVSSSRANVARWTKEQAPRVHAKYGFRCAICGSKNRLHAHHVDPVWHNGARARDFDNLITLCTPCHRTLHGWNLELELLKAIEAGNRLETFWDGRSVAPRPAEKRTPRIRRLVRSYSAVRRVEFAGHEMTYDLEVDGPYHNFVANGFVVHNSVNEYSGRYSVMPDEFYVPSAEQISAQSPANRQGGGDVVDADTSAKVLGLIRAEQRLLREGYEKMLAWDLRRELARINLGVAQYTEWYWKNDLHNVFHFLRLRLDEHAQYEIRVYAEAMATIVKAIVPVAWEAFADYQLHAEKFSRVELEALGRLLAGDAGDWPDAERVLAALPEPWRERTPEGKLKRNREREELMAKLARIRGRLRIP